MINLIRKKLTERQTYRELNSLSNKELTDIGISRSEIRYIARQHAAKIF